MKQKTLFIIITILVFSLLFSGCTENKTPDNTFGIKNNLAPIPILNNEIGKGFFDETIEFDASKSYDSDGKIVSYYWDFMDGTTEEGSIAQHVFRMQDEYNVEYPIIYTITLQLTDNNSTIVTYFYPIKLYPKKYTFYLDKGKLYTEKSLDSKETIKSNNLLQSDKYLLYTLNESIKITESTCNITLFLEKNILSKINEITIELIGDKNNVLETFEEKTNFNLWTNKKIQINKEITQEINLKSIKVSTYSLSILNQVDILYGDEKPSSISFEFNY